MDQPSARSARTAGIARGAAFRVEVDGRPIDAHPGETVLGVLWAAGLRTVRRSPVLGEPRGFFCGMGTCFDCLVTIDDRPNARACMEPVHPGMHIRTGAPHAD